MFRRRRIGLLLGASPWTSSAAAQEQPQPIVEITYERALALVRQQAPAPAAPLDELLAVRRERVQGQLDSADLLLGTATARAGQAASAEALR